MACGDDSSGDGGGSSGTGERGDASTSGSSGGDRADGTTGETAADDSSEDGTTGGGTATAETSTGGTDAGNDSSGGGSTDDGSTDAGTSGGAASSTGGETSGGQGTSTGGGPSTSTGGSSGGGTSTGGVPGCGAIDVLFVVDNSLSMELLQQDLGAEISGLVATLDAGLPEGTSVHFGITTTEMGFSANGSTFGCDATGDFGEPASTFYVTPEESDSGTAGAQGRLLPFGELEYYPWLTGSGDDAAADAVGWLALAVQPGTSGSNVEMLAAAAGWMAHPANDGTNDGFVRDAAVLAIYFLSDEPDQTPDVADDLLGFIDDAKPSCLAAECVVAGGPVSGLCTPDNALGAFLAGVTEDVTSPFAEGTLDGDLITETTGTFADATLDLCLAR